MQNIEKALFNVFTSIGSGYDQPTGEYIADVFNPDVSFRNPCFEQTPAAVKFSKGTQKELNIWLKDTKDKYPAVWLVYPVKKSFKNDAGSTESYPGLRLVFATNNGADKTVDERIHTTKVVLESIVSQFLALMRNSSFNKYISIDKKAECRQVFYPNYYTTRQNDGTPQSSSATIEIWDAITLDCDMILTPKCIPKN